MPMAGGRGGETARINPVGPNPTCQETTQNNRSESCVVVREGGTSRSEAETASRRLPEGRAQRGNRRQREVLAVKSSPETIHSSDFVSGVDAPGTMLACHQCVRHVRFGGVQAQGKASTGLTWNTGGPSFEGWQDDDRSRVERSSGPIPAARRQTKLCDEGSGRLNAPIVAFEGWRTRDGEEPVSSQGGRLLSGANVWKHEETANTSTQRP
jgi:hypothetical protein